MERSGPPGFATVNGLVLVCYYKNFVSSISSNTKNLFPTFNSRVGKYAF